MKQKITVILVLCLCLACLASADTVKLTNGQVIYGVFMGRSAEGISFLGPDGTTKTYPFSQVGVSPLARSLPLIHRVPRPRRLLR